MIEWIEARSGQWVPREDGNLLCSSIDPSSEGKKWVERYAASAGHFDVLVVLGLAGGYHIQALAQQFPHLEILVIEKNGDLEAELLSRRGRWPENVTIIAGNSLEALENNVFVRAALRTIFRVVKYPTSVRSHEEYYDKVVSFFSGRTPSGFRDQSRLRNGMKELARDLEFQDRNEGLSVLDIERAIKARERTTEREAVIWFALRELVQ